MLDVSAITDVYYTTPVNAGPHSAGGGKHKGDDGENRRRPDATQVPAPRPYSADVRSVRRIVPMEPISSFDSNLST